MARLIVHMQTLFSLGFTRKNAVNFSSEKLETDSISLNYTAYETCDHVAIVIYSVVGANRR